MQQEAEFDVVIVGAGITGSIIAKELNKQNKGLKILFLEAGTGKSSDFSDYESYNDRYYTALAKTPNSPYYDSEFAPSPSVLDVTNIPKGGVVSDHGYFVQAGPFPFLSNYNRNTGGTTLHWLGTTLRMCPNDFNMKTLYGHGRDWPLKYKDMMPYYRRAEYEIGVSADVEDQEILGIKFERGYNYPMHKIPQSYLDRHMAKGLKGTTIKFDGVTYPVAVVSTPQGRNGMPRKDYKNPETGKKGFTPKGAVGAPELGQRCEGNSNCVPICPVQAKYNALKTLTDAMNEHPENMNEIRVVNQSPVSTIEIDRKTKEVKYVHYKSYEYDDNGNRTNIKNHKVSGRIVVLAANAIENAKILLASKACKSSKQVGRNLMDHLCMLTWGYFPKGTAIGAYRGPGSTSGMPLTRDGSFRKNRSAFRVEIGNWGWNWPANTPESTMQDGVAAGLFGQELIDYIKDATSRQFRIAWEVEQIPSDENRVEISEDYKDDLGNYRPVIHYHVNDYEKAAAVDAQKMSDLVFKTLKVKDETTSDLKVIRKKPSYFRYEYEEDGKSKLFEKWFEGAGHVVGCHRMGTDPKGSVVDTHQRAHDHPNLFVAGCGSMPTLATSNPTLTMAALAMRCADEIARELRSKK